MADASFSFDKMSIFKSMLNLVGEQNVEYEKKKKEEYRKKEMDEYKKNGVTKPAGWMEKENPIGIVQFLDFTKYKSATSPFHFDTLRMLYIRDRSSSIIRTPEVDPYGEKSHEELTELRNKEEEMILRYKSLNRYILENLKVRDLIDWIYYMQGVRMKTGITTDFGIPFDQIIPNFMFLDLRELEQDFLNVYLKRVPSAHVHELTVDKKTKNFDGTYFYYIHMLEEMDKFILLESLIKEWSLKKNLHLLFDLKMTPVGVINKFADYCLQHVLNKIPDNGDPLNMAIAKLSEGYTIPEIPLPKKALDVAVALFLNQVPSEYSIGRPKDFIKKYNEHKKSLQLI